MNVHERAIFSGKVNFFRADLWRVVASVEEAKGAGKGTSWSPCYNPKGDLITVEAVAEAYHSMGVLAAILTAEDGTERPATRDEFRGWLYRNEGAIVIAPADEVKEAILWG